MVSPRLKAGESLRMALALHGLTPKDRRWLVGHIARLAAIAKRQARAILARR